MELVQEAEDSADEAEEPEEAEFEADEEYEYVDEDGNPISPEDLARFKATIGISDFLTIWEALAVLISIRL